MNNSLTIRLRLKAKKLLEIHFQQSIPDSLANSLGDGYLLQHNRIYRNIRSACLKFGYRFSSDFDLEYHSFPFGQLERIMQTKIIPYFDNVSALKKIVEKLQDNLHWKELNDGFKRNFIFHESCHSVVRSLGVDYLPPVSSPNHLVLQALLEESFANACELMAVTDADNSAHRLFYQLNSYTSLFEYGHHIRNLTSELGEGFILRYLTLSYLHSNFLKSELTPNEQKKLIENANLGSQIVISLKTKKSLLYLTRIAFTLDYDFRVLTTGLYLKLLGLSDSGIILKTDYMKYYEAEDRYPAFLKVLCDLAL